MEANGALELALRMFACVKVYEVGSCTYVAVRRSGAYSLLVAKLKTGGTLGASIEPDGGGDYQELPKEKKAPETIIGAVAINNGENH